ncbi:HAMP domain-containing histidine kinase [Halobacillus shinanisalinarum]|uniref:Heme sensor protein HssS n=1 Tax=Halobacillus shinanisalinarum TaxID=2932258 RepID=A0ABY4H544_9BACI|nr:HAMP domain-containing sensor histidine kinase [Halobacillus shinanisalinarum]UOQ95431.1 HAMP domain-containing histidine kinase [Halobacillus shinanisalinarum]
MQLYNDTSLDADTFFEQTAELSYQFYVTDSEGNGTFYGAPFRDQTLSSKAIEKVLGGTTYHGMANYPGQTFVTGFFSNELTNSIGVPVEINGEKHALFMRPNIEQQFNEIHILLAVLLVFTILLSMVLVLFSTRYIVKPIKDLTGATEKIAGGEYSIELKQNRKDEIGILARSFTSMSRQLEQVENMRQEFVSNVSHEIRTPLSSIKGYAKLLRSSSPSPEERDNYLQVIESESIRLSKLSRQLLTLAALDKDENITKSEPFTVAPILQNLLQQTRWLWESKGIAINLVASEVTYNGNEELLYQAFENLLTNSIKYTSAGGEISMTLREHQDGLRFTIQDNGNGISLEHQEKVFDRFYKVDTSRSQEKDSSGLGLSIVKKIITLHGGEIIVESELHKGSTFTVMLP